MEVFETSLSGIPLLRVTGEVDHFTSPDIDKAAQKALSLDNSRLLLDLTDCPYLDSGGLGVLLSLMRDIRAWGWLGVIGANRNLLHLFEIVGLLTEPAFHVCATGEEASAATAERGG